MSLLLKTALFLALCLAIHAQQQLFQLFSLKSSTLVTLSSTVAATSTMCSVQCLANAACGGFTYNLTGRNDCTLGKAVLSATTNYILESGNISSYVSIKYLDDYCFFTPTGAPNTDFYAGQEYCTRNGGKLPEPKTLQQGAHMATLKVSNPFSGLHGIPIINASAQWRWISDNALAGFSLPYIAGNCTYFGVIYQNLTWPRPCVFKAPTACQIC